MPGLAHRPRWMKNVTAAAKGKLRRRSGVVDKGSAAAGAPAAAPTAAVVEAPNAHTDDEPVDPASIPLPPDDVALEPNTDFNADEAEEEDDIDGLNYPMADETIAQASYQWDEPMEQPEAKHWSWDSEFTAKHVPSVNQGEQDPQQRHRLSRREVYERLRESAKKQAARLSRIPKGFQTRQRVEDEEEYERDPEGEYNLRETRWSLVRRSVSKRWSRISQPDPYPQSQYDVIDDSHIFVPRSSYEAGDDATTAPNVEDATPNAVPLPSSPSTPKEEAAIAPIPAVEEPLAAAAAEPKSTDTVPAPAETTTTTTAATTTTKATDEVQAEPTTPARKPLLTPRPAGGAVVPALMFTPPSPPSALTATAAAGGLVTTQFFNPALLGTRPLAPGISSPYPLAFNRPGIIGPGQPVTSKRGAARSLSAAMGSAGGGFMGMSTWTTW